MAPLIHPDASIAGIDFTTGSNTFSPRVVCGKTITPPKSEPDRGMALRDIICGRSKVKQLRRAK